MISPGGIGYDINCGVRLLKTGFTLEQIQSKLEELSKELYRQVPSGLGVGGRLQLTAAQMDKVLTLGAGWAVEQGYGYDRDLRFMESNGCLPGADPGKVSDRAKSRGRDQLGTIGSGNHFVEVDVIDAVYNHEI